MLRLLSLSALLAAALASCPNDCSGHGRCNVHSACECYRNWQSADCSKRTCYFSLAFVDTPQGDLNADGRVEDANVYEVTLTTPLGTGNDADASDDTSTDKGQAKYGKASDLRLPAGVLLSLVVDGSSTPSGKPTMVNSWAVTAAESVGYVDDNNRYAIKAKVTTIDGKAPYKSGLCIEKTTADPSVADDVAACATHSTQTGCEAQEVAAGGAIAACTWLVNYDVYAATRDTVTAASNAAYARLSITSTGTCTVSGGCQALNTWEHVGEITSENTKQPYVYNTQFTNKATWEKYPANHGYALAANSQKRYYDEAHFYAECSGKGTCNRDTGECQCFDGYTGSGCERLSCPNDCSGHGVCRRLAEQDTNYQGWDRTKTTTCVCDPGYQNVDCSDRICPSGDDPITREQVPSVQSFGYFHAFTSGSFALEFTDEFGDPWTTTTLSYDASAKDVENALEALPNSVVQDVLVDSHTISANWILKSSDDSELGTTGKFWTVTFLSNTGDPVNMGVRYSLSTDTAGQTILDSDTGAQGTFTKLEWCDSTTDKNCVSGDGTCTGTGSCDVAFSDLGSAAVCDAITDCSYTAKATGQTLATVDAKKFLGESFFGEGRATDAKFNFKIDETDPQIYLLKAQVGTKENKLCSSRGLCDHSTGLCKCFNGFTDDDCSRQNALAMY